MNSRSTFLLLFTLFLVLSAAAEVQAQSVRYFPHLADGGGYVTTWFFTGLGDGPGSVTIEFFATNGTPQVLQTSRGTAASFTFTLGSASELSIRTLGSPVDTQSGWARVTSTQPVGVTEVFQVISDGQVTTQAGVLPSDPTSASTLFVSIDGKGRSTGIAIANTGQSTNTIALTLYNQNGTISATSSMPLLPLTQVSRYVDELPGFERIGPIEGSLGISGSSGFSVVTLLLDGKLLAAVPALAGRATRSTSSISVPGITDITLSGQSAGYTVGADSAPLNSPVEAGLGLIPGRIVRISASGTVKNGSQTIGPDGSANNVLVRLNPPQNNGFAEMYATLSSLVGGFLGPAQPASPRPPTLDFSGGARDATRLQPLLQQPFFIGTGSSTSGTTKDIMIPDGATRLYLAVHDTAGGNSSNTGSFAVTLIMVP